MILKIQLLRHGKTYATDNSLYCGSTDLPLSENGLNEIEQYKEQNIYRQDTVFYTSDMMRAKQTKELIFGDKNSHVIPELNEMSFGRFEMQSYEQLLEDDDYIKWIEDKTGDMRCPDGESVNGFKKRMYPGFIKIYEDMIARKADKATIVCHGAVIAHYLNQYIETDNIFTIMPKPGRGFMLTLEYENSKIEIKDYSEI